MTDVLNALASIGPGSSLLALREQRAQAATHAQRSYQALFQPADHSGLSGLERAAIALRVAACHDEVRLVDHYRLAAVVAP